MYSSGATLYFAVTGELPPESTERPGAKITPPKQLGAILPRHAEQAILKALELDEKKRFQSIGAFTKALNKPDSWWDYVWLTLKVAVALAALVSLLWGGWLLMKPPQPGLYTNHSIAKGNPFSRADVQNRGQGSPPDEVRGACATRDLPSSTRLLWSDVSSCAPPR